MMSLWECTEGDKEWVPLPHRQAHGCAMDVLGFQAFLAENLLCSFEPLILWDFRH